MSNNGVNKGKEEEDEKTKIVEKEKTFVALQT